MLKRIYILKTTHLLILLAFVGFSVAGFGQTSPQNTRDSIYLNTLAKKYPAGITIEKSIEGNKKIERYIIVRNGKAKEFKKVYYSWGAKYYFALNYSITESTFLRETIALEGEAVKNVEINSEPHTTHPVCGNGER